MLELSLDTRVDLAASSIRNGAGLFETLRVVAGQPRRLEAHLERLGRGCRFMGLSAPPSVEQVRTFLEGCEGLGALDSGVLRLLAVDQRLHVFFAPWISSRPEFIRIGISHQIRRWSGHPANAFKTTSYLENLLLAREAQERGLFECLALNEAGRLTDGGRTNVFVVMHGELLTPPASDGALPGVARRTLLEAGLAREESLEPEALEKAEAVLLTNSLQGCIPVQALESGRIWKDAHSLIEDAGRILG